jgi:hypothetical protein
MIKNEGNENWFNDAVYWTCNINEVLKSGGTV